jgi:uncharacterized protein DUF6624
VHPTSGIRRVLQALFWLRAYTEVQLHEMSLLSSILNRLVAMPIGQVVIGSLFAPNKRLCFKLLWMSYIDQRARQTWLNSLEWDNQVDYRNTQVMKEIIAAYGWPGETLVGAIGTQAAWLLVQHADHDREFQKQCHHLLESAVKSGEAQAQHFAYLADRICVGDGVPQIYGTQLDYPITDLNHVDERRAAMGLDSLAEYILNSSKMQTEFKMAFRRKRAASRQRRA